MKPLPDGPKFSAFLQQAWWLARSINFLDACAQKYGDPFTVKVFGSTNPSVFFSDPQAIQAVYTASPKQFDSGSANYAFRPVMGSYSVLLLDGERHQRQRRLLAPPFHGERMRAYSQLIIDVTQEVISEWKFGKSFSVRDLVQEITLQIILGAIFGLDKGERFQTLKRLLQELLSSITSPWYSTTFFFPFLQKNLGTWSPWGDFLYKRQQIDDLIYAEIGERRKQFNPTRTDILSLMMAACDEQGQPMSDVELRDELVTLLVAGHETTASALAWALYWIHYYPQVGEKLLQELDAVSAHPDTILRLPYLNAVCSETLRIHPVSIISLPRILKSPMELMGYQFEAGTILVPCIYLAHRRPEQYPEPQKFNPERFLSRKFSPYEYLPFGGGDRRCVGFAFALFEMKIVLATILTQFQLSLATPQVVQPERRGITMSPSGGVKMVLIKRR
jgi:unspecific monooxygenase